METGAGSINEKSDFTSLSTGATAGSFEETSPGALARALRIRASLGKEAEGAALPLGSFLPQRLRRKQPEKGWEAVEGSVASPSSDGRRKGAARERAQRKSWMRVQDSTDALCSYRMTRSP